MSNFLVLLRTAVCLAKKVAVCAVSLRETPALFCSLLTGRETEPAHPPQTPFSPSSPYKHNSLLCCYFSRIRVFKPQGDLPFAPSSRTRGWEENQKGRHKVEELSRAELLLSSWNALARQALCVAARPLCRGCPRTGGPGILWQSEKEHNIVGVYLNVSRSAFRRSFAECLD